MMSPELDTLGLFKLKVTWNIGFYIINFVHDFTNKMLSRYSNYIVNVAIWPKLGNSNLFMTEDIMTSNL